MTLTAPFDAVAPAYDATFTHTQLGRWLRDIVRAHIPVQAGQRVLELGCGTGEDALWLARQGAAVTATDASYAMLHVAERKAAAAAIANPPRYALLDINAPQVDGGPFDGVFANFGVVNCATDLPALADFLAAHTQPGAWVAFVVMGPVCAWEIGWYLAHLDAGRAFRRLQPSQMAHAGGGQQVQVGYPSPGAVRRAFAPAFMYESTRGIGVALPPSYLSGAVDRHPRPFGLAAQFDRQVGVRWPFYHAADHYLITLRRRR